MSSLAVDCVWIDEDGRGAPTWRRYELAGSDAWERCRQIGSVFPAPSSEVWDETVAVGIEVAYGPSSGAVNRCVGAVLSRLPQPVLVQPWIPSQWRKAVGLPGNCSKAEVALLAHKAVREWEIAFRQTRTVPWPQDACDAFCIALATKNAIHREEVAA